MQHIIAAACLMGEISTVAVGDAQVTLSIDCLMAAMATSAVVGVLALVAVFD